MLKKLKKKMCKRKRIKNDAKKKLEDEKPVYFDENTTNFFVKRS